MQEYPYNQPPNYPAPKSYVGSDEVNANLMFQEELKNIIAQISPDKQLYEIEMRIKGYRKNFTTMEWEKISKDVPEPNPLLIRNYVGFLSSILNQGTPVSNLTSLQINKIMKLIIEWLVDDLDNNGYDYGLSDNYTERTRIGLIILNSTFLTLSRSLNGVEARRMWNSLKLTESLNEGEKKQGGVLSALKFWQ